jgi:hypothetical protein
MVPITNTGAENIFVEGIGHIEVNVIVMIDLAMVTLAECACKDLNSIGFTPNVAWIAPQIVCKHFTANVSFY